MKILYIEGCNYIDFPIGGQLTFARQMVSVFKNEISLVGFVTENYPIGSWQKKMINGVEYNFFALFNAMKSAKMPLLPRRLRVYFALLKFKRKILQMPFDLVVTRSPEVVIPVSKWGLKRFCYYFAGTGNPLALSRRSYARFLARFYDSVFFQALKKVPIILAAADTQSVQDVIKRSNNILKEGDIRIFPTRIDTNIFKKTDVNLCREKLGIDQDKIVISTSGRLHWVKGWKLILEAYQIFLYQCPESNLFIVGDGNERASIENFISDNHLEHKIRILGFKNHETLANYINASNLFVMGSVMEGWATSLIEAKACGVPVCITNFSSANELIKSGVDGFVVNEREPSLFAQKMLEALNLRINPDTLQEEIKKFSLENLKQDFLNACNLEY